MVKVFPLYAKKRSSAYRVLKEGEELFLKVFHGEESLLKGGVNLLVNSRPRREFLFSNYLADRGIRTIRAVRYGEKRLFSLFPVNVGYVVYPFVSSLVPLSSFVKERDFHSLLERAVSISARLHSFGVYHGDLSLSNFVLKDRELLLIDFENMRFLRPHFLASFEFPDFINDVFKWAHRLKLEFEPYHLLSLYLDKISLPSFVVKGMELKLRRLLEKSSTNSA